MFDVDSFKDATEAEFISAMDELEERIKISEADIKKQTLALNNCRKEYVKLLKLWRERFSVSND